MKSTATSIIMAALLTGTLVGCATEASRRVEVAKPATAHNAYTGAHQTVSVGKFDNRSSFLRGIFSDGIDRLGSQAKTILLTHLQLSNHFNVLDRDNMSELKQEAKLSGATQRLRGAHYVITGDVTEFGRKQVGDRQLFGILGRGKSQIAYAKVSLSVVDVRTSRVVFSTQSAGEYSLSNREVIGFGGTSSYDATLNGKVLDMAIRGAVDNLATGLETGAWGSTN